MQPADVFKLALVNALEVVERQADCMRSSPNQLAATDALVDFCWGNDGACAS